jgi:hypothetical protein
MVPAGAVAAATTFHYSAAPFAANQGRSFLTGDVMRLTAEDAASAAPIRSFAAPLTLRTTIDAATLRDAAWRAGALSFYYFDPASEAWVALASESDGQGGVSAHTTHFTDFGVGMAPQDKIIPSVHSSATVDAWTGAAAFSYPIEVVPGRNGLQPSVSLSYSSGSVDDMYNSDQNWGENRYTDGTTPTTYHFTGQREESGLGAGVYFYGARWYDAALGASSMQLWPYEFTATLRVSERGSRNTGAGRRIKGTVGGHPRRFGACLRSLLPNSSLSLPLGAGRYACRTVMLSA